MAEGVHYLLEDTVPELEDLRTLRLFSKDEIKIIVKRRTDFEYALKRRTMRKADVLRYATYEMNLDTLRRLRKHERGITKNSLSDHTMVRRIHFIFERGIRKFGGDLKMWLQFIDYARRAGSRQTLNRLFVRALQFHPLEPGLWIMAASYEQTETYDAALLQRALRLCPHVENLWVQYCRLELMYWSKVKQRQEILFGKDFVSDEDRQPAAEEAISLGELPDESTLDTENDPIQDPLLRDSTDTNVVANMKNKFLKGAIIKAVYHAAIIAIPSSVSLRQSLGRAVKEFDGPSELLNMIYESIMKDFQHNPDAVAVVCERSFPTQLASLPDDALLQALEKTHENYMTHLETHPDARVMEHFVQFLGTMHGTEALREAALVYFERALEYVQQSPSLQSESLFLTFLDQHLQLLNDHKELFKIATAARDCVPSSVRLWLAWARLSVITHQDFKGVLEQLDRVLPKLRGDVGMLLRWRFTATTELMHNMDESTAQSQLLKVVDDVTRLRATEPQVAGELEGDLILWVLNHRGVDMARAVADRYLARPAPSQRVLDVCYDMEIGQTPINLPRVRKIYQLRVDRQPACADAWLDWIKTELERDEFQHVQVLYQRAIKHVADSTSFVARYTELIRQ